MKIEERYIALLFVGFIFLKIIISKYKKVVVMMYANLYAALSMYDASIGVADE